MHELEKRDLCFSLVLPPAFQTPVVASWDSNCVLLAMLARRLGWKGAIGFDAKDVTGARFRLTILVLVQQGETLSVVQSHFLSWRPLLLFLLINRGKWVHREQSFPGLTPDLAAWVADSICAPSLTDGLYHGGSAGCVLSVYARWVQGYLWWDVRLLDKHSRWSVRNGMAMTVLNLSLPPHQCFCKSDQRRFLGCMHVHLQHHVTKYWMCFCTSKCSWRSFPF